MFRILQYSPFLLCLGFVCLSFHLKAQETKTDSTQTESNVETQIELQNSRLELEKANQINLDSLVKSGITAADSTVKSTRKEKYYEFRVRKKLGRPSKAALLSGILPGLGQIYNGKIWKVPIALAGLGTLGFFVNVYHNRYIESRDNLFFLSDGNPETFVDPRFVFFTEDNLRRRRDRSRRDRDYYIIISTLAYGLVVADAAVDGHLNQFDVSDDLSLKIKPKLLPLQSDLAIATPNFIPGISLVLQLK